MRVFLPVLMAALTVVGLASQAMEACGDKFLLVGRGVKFQRAYAAVYPASIVIFAQPQRSAAKAIRDPRLQTDLKQAGHRVVLVESDAALAHALESDKVDLVLTDVADADRTSKQGAVVAVEADGAAGDVRADPRGSQGDRIALSVPPHELRSRRSLPCDD